MPSRSAREEGRLGPETHGRLSPGRTSITGVVASAEMCRIFRSLHADGCFVMPNPWDAGSAKALSALDFPALATTSAGFGFSAGVPDDLDVMPLERTLANIAEIVAAVAVPISADFQNGHSATDDLDQLSRNVRACIETGVAGLSLEDVEPGSTGPVLLPAEQAIARIRVARQTIDSSGVEVTLTGRSECFLYDHPDPLTESISRLQAYVDAGADVVFAPGIRRKEEIATLVAAMSPTPVNVILSGGTGLTVRDLAAAGVRRISVGSTLSRIAWGAFLSAARQLADGADDALTGASTFDELNTLFSD